MTLWFNVGKGIQDGVHNLLRMNPNIYFLNLGSFRELYYTEPLSKRTIIFFTVSPTWFGLGYFLGHISCPCTMKNDLL